MRWLFIATILTSIVLVQGVHAACANPPAGTIFCDDFEAGNFNSWDQTSSTYVINTNAAFVKTGSRSMQGTVGSGGTMDKWFMPGYDEVWIQMDVLFESGFQNMRGDGYGMHFFTVGGNDINNQWSSFGQAGIKPTGTNYFSTLVEPLQSFNDPTLRPFIIGANYVDMSCNPTPGCYAPATSQSSPAVPLVGGTWQQLTLHYKANTVGQSDGFMEMYIDGVKKIDVQNMRWRTTNNLRWNSLDFTYYMPSPPRTQRIWVDNVVVATQSLIGGTTPPPTTNPEDVNGDNVVNVQDVLLIANCIGQSVSGTCTTRDINGDGAINIFDFVKTAQRWGQSTTDTTPPTATITAPTASQVLAVGTTSTTLSVTTNEAATCRWSTTDVAYASMTNTMTGGGSTAHSSTLTGLANGQAYTRYVRCQDTTGNAMTSSQSRTFSVATSSTTIPPAPGSPSFSVATARSTTSDILMTWSGATGATYYDYTSGLSGTGSWPGQQGTVSTTQATLLNVPNGAGIFACVLSGNTVGESDTSCNAYTVPAGASDTIPPTASITAPTANQVLAAGTTSTTLSVTTNEAATCRWSTTDVAYASMTNTFSTTGGTSHSTSLSGLSNGQAYTRYVRCIDASNNAMTTSQSRSFSVASPSATCGNGVIEGTEECDGSALGGATCTTRGFTGGTLSCSASCTFNTNACTGQNLYPNKPANYNTVTQIDFSQNVPTYVGGNNPVSIASGNGWQIPFGGSPRFSKTTDVDAPVSGPGVWRVDIPAGTYGSPSSGSGFGDFYFDLGSTSSSFHHEVYVAVSIKWDGNGGFEWHPVSNKWFELTTGSPTTQILVQSQEGGLWLNPEILTLDYHPGPTVNTPISSGWHKVEFLIKKGSSGTIKIWMDGQLVTNLVGINVPDASSDSWEEFYFRNFRGGGGETKQRDSWILYDHIYIASPN